MHGPLFPEEGGGGKELGVFGMAWLGNVPICLFVCPTWRGLHVLLLLFAAWDLWKTKYLLGAFSW